MNIGDLVVWRGSYTMNLPPGTYGIIKGNYDGAFPAHQVEWLDLDIELNQDEYYLEEFMELYS